MTDFRPATLADVAVLRHIETSCFSDPWTEDMLESEIEMPHSRYVVMLQDGTVAGYYAYMHVLDEVHILNVAVLPGFQGRGLGRILMRHLLSNLPDGVVGVTLEVRVGNTRAIRLYESLGFVRQGLRKGYYAGEDAAIYWLTEGD